MRLEIKADIAGFERAVKRLAELQQKSCAEVLQTAAKGFVKTAQAWTPPGGPSSQGTAAKKRGEESARRDLARLMFPTRKSVAAPGSIEFLHRSARDRKGRTRRSGRKLAVPAAEYRRYEKRLLQRVGWLAAGWNAAANRLGVRVPAWIARHGSGAGQISVTLRGFSPSIEIRNRVKYAGTIEGLQSRIGRALESQRKAMERQIAWLVARDARRAGF